MEIRFASIALATCFIAACGGASGGGGGGGGGGNDDGTCTGTLTGSVNGTITDCRMVWTELTDGTAMVGNDYHISSTGDDDNTYSALGINFLTSGDPHTGTLDPTNTVSADAGLTLPNGGGYLAVHDTRAPDAPMFGTASITITSFDLDYAGRWILHGTASAQLLTPPGVTTYSGSAVLSLSF